MHCRIHLGLKPHCCSECGKQFSRKMLLKQHVSIKITFKELKILLIIWFFSLEHIQEKNHTRVHLLGVENNSLIVQTWFFIIDCILVSNHLHAIFVLKLLRKNIIWKHIWTIILVTNHINVHFAHKSLLNHPIWELTRKNVNLNKWLATCEYVEKW